jgi:hypothetical protein
MNPGAIRKMILPLRIDDTLQAAAGMCNGADYTITDRKNNAGSRETNELTFITGDAIRKPQLNMNTSRRRESRENRERTRRCDPDHAQARSTICR